MLHIAICDDEQACVKDMSERVKTFFESKNLEIVLDTFLSPNELLKSDVMKYKIIFLDVDMGTENGIDVAKQIRAMLSDVMIIYVSQFVQYAIDGYSVQAFQYLLKSDLDRTFSACLEEVLLRLPTQIRQFTFETANGMQSILLKDILYLESKNHKIEIRLQTGEVFSYTGKLSQAEQDLCDKDFLRIQKSYLVNMWHIHAMKSRVVTLDSGERINCGKEKYQQVLQTYLLWEGER